MTLFSIQPRSCAADQPPFCSHLVVGKACLNIPPTKESTEGQLALESFLARRRQKYQARRNGLARNSFEESICDGSFSDKEAGRFDVHDRNRVIRLAILKHGPMPLHHATRTLSPVQNAKEAKLDDFSRLDCEVLADRVVSRAKVRLKRRKKTANVLQKIYKPSLNSSQCKVPTFRTSTPTNSKSSTPKSLSPSKTIQRLNRSLEVVESGSEDRRSSLKVVRKVVYWSEKQSAMAKDSGVPCVPPSSPMHSKFEWFNLIFTSNY